MKIKALHRVEYSNGRGYDWEDCYILQFLQKSSGGFNVIFVDITGHLGYSSDFDDFQIKV